MVAHPLPGHPGRDRQLHGGRAALQLSKASVSQRIAELEKAVGLPLVRRTTRGVSLTEAGAHLVEQTAAAFQRIEAGYSAVKDLSGGPRACWP